MAKRDLKYFMREREEQIISVPGPETFTDENGNVLDLEIRVLSNTEIQKINNNYRKRSIATDKKGQPYIANGEVVFKTEKDSAKAPGTLLPKPWSFPT